MRDGAAGRRETGHARREDVAAAEGAVFGFVRLGCRERLEGAWRNGASAPLALTKSMAPSMALIYVNASDGCQCNTQSRVRLKHFYWAETL